MKFETIHPGDEGVAQIFLTLMRFLYIFLYFAAGSE